MSTLRVAFLVGTFLGSFLLFLVEPLVGKRLLPLLGGSAAVWTTCLVFFQVTLLLGYLGAHWIATRLKSSRQSLSYLAVLGIAVVQLAATRHYALRADTAHPIRSVFGLLDTLIGIPFVALAAASPLFQSWYAQTAPDSAGPPPHCPPPLAPPTTSTRSRTRGRCSPCWPTRHWSSPASPSTARWMRGHSGSWPSPWCVA